ncbi:hypothetical protein DRW48_00550 [Paracoccus suum]|uniref:YHS domain-containing protein n=1 Tax=Paracoccus suum TaxID=2259340 RepID=A0A344PG87_9RHOB|nr:YHS domain-containing (seleno)protein [Paracoccus suum]AXC48392.1 hypothetical protein DRW48_00550 [Paracoccus suum]
MLKPAILATLIAGLLPSLALAASWALGGMDAVAYRTQNAAVPGQATIATRWGGQEWHFSSEDHRALFEANPRAYAPGFDGHCPVSLAEGQLREGNPRYFAIVGQRLYFFRSNEARGQFAADPRRWLMEAKAAFVKLAQ